MSSESKPEAQLLERGSDHYKRGTIQPIEFIFANGLGFAEGNVVKYVTRYQFSGTPIKDLEKARHYIDMLIEHAERSGL